MSILSNGLVIPSLKDRGNQNKVFPALSTSLPNTNNDTSFDPPTMIAIPQRMLYDSIEEDPLLLSKKTDLFQKQYCSTMEPINYLITLHGQHEDENNGLVEDDDTLSMA